MNHEQIMPISESLDDLTRIYGVHVITMEQAQREEQALLEEMKRHEEEDRYARDWQRQDEDRSRIERIEVIRRDEGDREERTRLDRDLERQHDEQDRYTRDQQHRNKERSWMEHFEAMRCDGWEQQEAAIREEEAFRRQHFEAMKRDVLAGQEQKRNRRLIEGGQLNQEETCNAQLIRDCIRLVTHSLDVSISSSNANTPCTLQVCSLVPVGESAVHQRYAKLWHEEWSWPQLPNIDEFTRVVALLLENREYFTKCECCGVRKPAAFVEGSICMACLENYFEVLF